jgi:hypothetical protein
VVAIIEMTQFSKDLQLYSTIHHLNVSNPSCGSLIVVGNQIGANTSEEILLRLLQAGRSRLFIEWFIYIETQNNVTEVHGNQVSELDHEHMRRSDRMINLLVSFLLWLGDIRMDVPFG